MSASREKKMRQNKPDEQTKAAPAKKNNKVLKAVIAVVLVVAILGATVFFGLLNNGSLNSKLTALTINDHQLSAGMLNYYYLEARQQLSDDLGSLFQLAVDTSAPLGQQPYMNDSFDTWGDYVLDMAIRKAAQAYALYDDAMANGFTLSEDGAETIQADLDAVEYVAMMYGYASGEAYIASSYGTGCNLENYREFLTVQITNQEYTAKKIEDLQYSPEEIDAHYTENAAEYDSVSFQMFNLTTDMAENTEEAAKEMAASIKDEKHFNELAKSFVDEELHSYYDKGAITYFRDYTAAEAEEDCREWLFADERKPGDTTYIAFETDEESGYHVLHFIEKTDLNYKVSSFHQIVVDVTSTDEEILAVAEEEAQAILDTYLNGDDQTESAFLAIMNQQTESSYTGTYRNTGHGAMISDYENWIFDEARQPGDTTVIKSELGYHVIYFVGFGDSFYNYSITEDLREADFNEWLTGIVSTTKSQSRSFPMSLVNKY